MENGRETLLQFMPSQWIDLPLKGTHWNVEEYGKRSDIEDKISALYRLEKEKMQLLRHQN